MKKPEKYLKNKIPFNENGGYGKDTVLEIIKQVQIDTIDTVVNLCAESQAKFDNKYEVLPKNVTRLRLYEASDYTNILKVADKLKKELNE